MSERTLYAAAGPALILAAIGWALSVPAYGQVQYQLQVLHGFGSPGDGVAPQGGLVFDQKGNLYGVTNGGGGYNDGAVFELTPGANGEWTETILHSFLYGQGDGYQPTGVIGDGAGNLYGTTSWGGLNDYGTVFELTPGANGEWTESILWNFCSLPDCADGWNPMDAPTLNPAGGLYGVTGGSPGTAFELTPGSNRWTFTLLYTFCSQPNCSDGDAPSASLILDAKGILFGEAGGGTGHGSCGNGCGVVFALQPKPDGQWKEVVLHDFGTGKDGAGPHGGVTLYEKGLYGTTESGGGLGCEGGGCGTVFELEHRAGNRIDEQILRAFGANDAQGILPLEGVAFDEHGDLFGVTGEGGADGDGVVYGMRRQSNGQWGFQVVHTFAGSDGILPDDRLTIDSKGNLYGTTFGGGQYGVGVVYELSPVKQAPK